MPKLDRQTGPVVHMIGNAHIDPVWLWTRNEGERVVLDTVRTVVGLMAEYPEMTFTFAQAQSYQWVEAKAPEVFERIRRLVADGRWHIVGGMWVQPDCNIPSGEAFVRHLLYSQRYFFNRFGKRATVGYNVDSFGHAGTLPQLLSKGGLDSYVYFRPDPQKEIAIDEALYWWQSPDGSQVLACRPPNHYGTWAGEIEAWIVNSVVHAPERVGAVLCFYGVGDHGGGPTRENLESIRAVAERADMPPVIFGSLADFFARAREARCDYSVRRAELQHHAPGCYSVHSDIKRWNRQAEQKLVAVEKANAILAMLGSEPLAGTMAFEEAWQRVLFNQFHDILAGTSIPEAYEDARADFAEVGRVTDGINRVVLERLAAASDCRGDGQAVFVFNPCSWPTVSIIEVDGALGSSASLSGQSLPCQRAYDGQLLVSVTLPAVGGACLHINSNNASAGEPPGDSAVSATENGLENEFWRLYVNPNTGEWMSLYDKEVGVEVFAKPGNALVVLDDPSDTWSHGVRGYHVEVGRFVDAKVTIAEVGPLRASLLVKRRFGRSLVQERVSLCAGQRAIEVCTTLDWHDARKALKVSFPVAVGYPLCTYEAPYGITVRVPNGEEEPGQTWVDASGVARTQEDRAIRYGVSLLNDCKYGFDMKAHGGYGDADAWTDVRMTLLRSPAYAFHDPRPFDPDETYTFIDQGRQVFSYWLLPHRDSWREAGTVRLAHERNAPHLLLATPSYEGGLPPAWSFLECRDPGVEVAAVKLAEASNDLILRLHEARGSDCRATVLFPLWGLEIAVPLGHHEVKTLRLSRQNTKLWVQEVNLLEEPVSGGFAAVYDFE
ncbi:MAG: alpha-mannosidase [Anaerolineae bacterium]